MHKRIRNFGIMQLARLMKRACAAESVSVSAALIHAKNTLFGFHRVYLGDTLRSAKEIATGTSPGNHQKPCSDAVVSSKHNKVIKKNSQPTDSQRLRANTLKARIPEAPADNIHAQSPPSKAIKMQTADPP